MKFPTVADGMYPSAVGRTALFSNHRVPAALAGSYSQIAVVIPTLISNPPSTYSLLLYTAVPPGSVVAPGVHGSVATVVMVSATGSKYLVSVVPTVPPPSEPPTTTTTGVPATVSTPPRTLEVDRSAN